MQTNDPSKQVVSSRRVRIGLGLWILGLLPFPILLEPILHYFDLLTTPKSSRNFILIMWTIQYIIGFIGLFMAGKETIKLARAGGYRQLPNNLWNVLRPGD